MKPARDLADPATLYQKEHVVLGGTIKKDRGNLISPASLVPLTC